VSPKHPNEGAGTRRQAIGRLGCRGNLWAKFVVGSLMVPWRLRFIPDPPG
jgi:hypothetical protein